MKNLITRLFLDKSIPEIKYSDLDGSGYFQDVLLNEGISSERIPLWNEGSLKFRVCQQAGKKFNKHYHDCKEIIDIKSGRLLHKGYEWGPGERLIIQALVPHNLEAIEDSVYYVEFLEPTF